MAQSDRTGGISPSTPDAPQAPAGDAGTAWGDTEERRRRISEAAYYRAQQRGFSAGQEHDDWLEAEKDVDRGTPTNKKLEDNDFPSPK